MIGLRFAQYTAPDDNRTPFEKLLEIFLELLVHTSGDVEEAFDWLKELDDEYKLTTPDYTLADFRRDLEKQNYFKPLYIDTRPYPGFSTDMQSPIAVLLTQAKGQSHIFETLFEGRFNYVKELVKMGADCKLKDNHNLFIKGPKKLKGKTIYCSDLRAGAALLLATLMAKGESTIENIELIERGYENIDARLNQIGANIKRVL